MKFKALILLFSFCTGSLFSNETAAKQQDFLGKDFRELQLYSLAAAFALNLQIAFSGKGAFSDLSDASDISQGFVNAIAQDHTITDNLQIKMSDGYAAGFNTILIPYDVYSSLANDQLMSEIDALYVELSNAQDPESMTRITTQLCEHIGALDHEFTHYKNKDLRNYLILSTLTNFIVYASYLTFETHFLAEKIKNAGEIKKFFYALSSGIGLTAATSLINSWIARTQEKKADEGVRNHPHILNAMIIRYERMQEQIKEYYRNSNSWIHRKYATLLEKYPSSYLLFDPIHPPLPDRVARFQERLDVLEKSALTTN